MESSSRSKDRNSGSTRRKSSRRRRIRPSSSTPKYDLAWHIEGRWNLSFAEVSSVKRALAAVTYGKLPVTNFEDAARCFEKAIELNPNRLMHYIELGRTYVAHGQAGRGAEAFITKGLSMHETEKDDPETKREGRELLAKCR